MRPPTDYETQHTPAPTSTTVTRPFWQAAAEGVLLLQRCESCGQHVFYPRAICPHCWSNQLGWVPASGAGSLETWSTVIRPAHPAWEEVAPYSIGLVRLAEGPTLLSHLLAKPESLALHQPLAVRFRRFGSTMLPCFEPAK